MKKFEDLTEEEQEEVTEFAENNTITYGEINAELLYGNIGVNGGIVSNFCEPTNYRILGFWCKECGKRYMIRNAPRINSIYSSLNDEKDEKYAKHLHEAVIKHAMCHFETKKIKKI